MSRINDALRAWEDSVGVVSREPDAFRGHPIGLKEYATEPSSSVAPAPPADVRSSPPPATRPVAAEHAAPVSEHVAPTGERAVPKPERIARAPERTAPPRARRQEPAPVTSGAAVDVADTRRTEEAAARLVTTTGHTFSVEQYRRLAATLHDGQAQGGLRSVLITSAAPREGKTLTGVNLAFTLSESYGRRVLLVDADLRCPGVHALLRIPNQRGLSEALNGDGDLPIVQVSSRLSVMTAGSTETPLAGLSSSRMRALLEECERRFDWVLVDTPPVGVLPDAQLLTRLAGAVVFVIGANATPAALVARAVAELGPERIIGTVLNRVESDVIADGNYVDRYHATHTGRAS